MGSPPCQPTALPLSSSALRESNPSSPLWGTPPNLEVPGTRLEGPQGHRVPFAVGPGGARLRLHLQPHPGHGQPSRELPGTQLPRCRRGSWGTDGDPAVPAGIQWCRWRWAPAGQAGTAPGWSRGCSCFSSLLFVLPKRVGCHHTDTTATPSRPAPGDPGLAQRQTPGGEATLEPTVPVPGGTNPDTSWDPSPAREKLQGPGTAHALNRIQTGRFN